MENERVISEDGDITVENLDFALREINDETMDAILDNFDSFKDYLQARIHDAKKFDITEDQLVQATIKINNYLAKYVQPRNKEEQLLMELWKIANEDEQKAFAQMLIKFITKEDEDRILQ